jgi:hypothetical protein
MPESGGTGCCAGAGSGHAAKSVSAAATIVVRLTASLVAMGRANGRAHETRGAEDVGGSAVDRFRSRTSSKITTLKGALARLPEELRSHEGMSGSFGGFVRQIPATSSPPERELERRHFDVYDVKVWENVVAGLTVHVSYPFVNQKHFR